MPEERPSLSSRRIEHDWDVARKDFVRSACSDEGPEVDLRYLSLKRVESVLSEPFGVVQDGARCGQVHNKGHRMIGLAP